MTTDQKDTAQQAPGPDFTNHADLCEWHRTPGAEGYYACEPRCQFFGGDALKVNELLAALKALDAVIHFEQAWEPGDNGVRIGAMNEAMHNALAAIAKAEAAR